jgi:hypothetical protein
MEEVGMRTFQEMNQAAPVPEERRNAIILSNIKKAAERTSKTLSKDGEKIDWPKGSFVVCRTMNPISSRQQAKVDPKTRGWEYNGTVQEIDTESNRVWVKWVVPPPGEEAGKKSLKSWGDGYVKRAPWLDLKSPSKQPLPESLMQISPDINRISLDIFAETIVASPPKTFPLFTTTTSDFFFKNCANRIRSNLEPSCPNLL